MPSLSVSFSPRLGPLIQVAILPPTTDEAVVPLDFAPKFSALIDTGASCTSISGAVIDAVGLPPVGRQPVGGVHGLQSTNLYQFVVGLTFSKGAPSLKGVAQPHVYFRVLGTEFVPGQAPFDVLLGRDVLCEGVLTMTFDGRMTFGV